jgi:hypothetical protein
LMRSSSTRGPICRLRLGCCSATRRTVRQCSIGVNVPLLTSSHVLS